MMRYLTRAIVLVLPVIAACSDEPPSGAVAGDVKRGRHMLASHGCGVCHEIPGVPAARGQVGPPLNNYRRHVYVAGRFPNTPEVVVAWIKDAPAMAPDTAMPDLPVGDRDARDMAAYLFTLD